MLPLHAEDQLSSHRPSSARSHKEYLRMFLKYAQLDIDYTLTQMLYLLVSPKKVYQLTSYRKQTKNHWSRDDPAFIICQVGLLVLASAAFAFAFGASWIRVAVQSILLHYFVLGLTLCTAYYYICNLFLKVDTYHGNVRQRLEWLYAWDIHCNSFVPVYIFLYVIQFLLLPFCYDDGGLNLSGGAAGSTSSGAGSTGDAAAASAGGTATAAVYSPSFGRGLLANSVFMLSLLSYFYVTSMGYATLPFLERTEVLLWPCIFLVLLILTFTLLKINLTTWFVAFLVYGRWW